MCLITEQQKPHIAQEDIIVYKILKKTLVSMYQFFQYKLGKLYHCEIKETNIATCFDDRDQKILEKKYPNWDDIIPELKYFDEGFHSAISKNRLKSYVDDYHNIFKCTIPKGSEYYTEPSGLVVSNQIIINKKA